MEAVAVVSASSSSSSPPPSSYLLAEVVVGAAAAAEIQLDCVMGRMMYRPQMTNDKMHGAHRSSSDKTFAIPGTTFQTKRKS